MTDTRYEIGDLIENRYRVRMVIESGKAEELYQVSDEAQNAEVVTLKILKGRDSLIEVPDSIERFQREFLILTQLRHPNLVSVYDYGITAEDQLYFTMEWIDGQNLASRLGSFAAPDTIPIIVQICRALAYLHARDVIHGGLKPYNVLMAGDRVKVVDFGLAHEVRSDQTLTPGFTPGYTAPEVAKHESEDHRSDLYSLGALWYALLMGKPPMFLPTVGMERMLRFTLQEALEIENQTLIELSALISRLLAQSPEKRYASANAVLEAVNALSGSTYELETRETAGSYALRARFLGRAAELEKLREIWEQARDQHAGLVLISGESGVGKTRLVEELEVEVEMTGARVVWGQCLESGGSAYQPWREVLRVLLRYVETVDGLDLQRVGPVLATIMPELWSRPYMDGLAPPAKLEPQAARQRLNDAILQVLLAAAQTRPTLVVIEDAHWGDEASLELLRYLGRVLGNPGLLVCVTYRSDDVFEANGDAQAHVLVELSGESVQRIVVDALPAEETQQLVRSMLGLQELPVELAERVQGTTGGNTFFVQELIRSLAEEGQVLQRTVAGWQVDQAALQVAQLPGTIQQVIWRRLEQLSEPTQQVLSYAAVVGPVFWEGAIEQVGGAAANADAEQGRVRAALSEARERELVLLRDETAFAGEREYLFVKSAMQEVSYESLTQEQRLERHARVAEWLIARPDEQVNEHLGLVADHLQASQQTEPARSYLRRAGEQAAAQFANAQAIGYFSRALDMTPEDDRTARYELLLERERVQDLLGARAAQRKDLQALTELADVETDAFSRAKVALRWSAYRVSIGDYPAAIASAQVAIEAAQIAQDTESEANGYAYWGYALRLLGEYEAAKAQLGKALTLAQEIQNNQVSADSLRELGVVCSRVGDYKLAGEYYRQALGFYRRQDDRRGEAETLNYLGLIQYFLGDFVAAFDRYEQALSICNEIGDQYNEAGLLCNLGYLFIALGDYVTAKTYAQDALDRFQEIVHRYGLGIALGHMGIIAHYLGNDYTARQFSQQAVQITSEAGNKRELGLALTILGDVLTGLKRWTEAATAFQQAVDLRRELGQEHLVIESQARLIRVFLGQGDLIRAQALTVEIVDYLENNTLVWGGDLMQIYLTCYQVLRACDEPKAQDILSTTYHLLQERAAKIRDEEMRHSFLENVATHREIMAEYDIHFSSPS